MTVFSLKSLVFIIVKFCIRLLKAGNIPQHVAIIPDGNRRFARQNQLSIKNGHSLGKERVLKLINWSYELGIKEITVYIFAIKNFQRSRKEVDDLMDVIKSALQYQYSQLEELARKGISYNVIGNLQLLPKDVLELAIKLREATNQNIKMRVNIALAYSGQEEIYSATKELIEGIQKGFIQLDDINENAIESCMYTSNSPEPDLLIRTSGENRLSDFLLWQTCYTVMIFIPIYWYEINVWHLFKSLIEYQRCYKNIQKWKLKEENAKQHREIEAIEKHIKLNTSNETSNSILNDYTLLSYKREKQERLNKFIQHLQQKRERMLKSLINE